MADASGSLAAGDPYFLGVTAAVTVGYQMLFFLVTAACKFDTVTDLAGGTNFVILALLTLFLPPRTLFTRQWVLSALVVAWGLRLSGFLFFRILRWGEDRRFDAHRKSFARLAVFWTLQVSLLTTPSPSLTADCRTCVTCSTMARAGLDSR
jgi:steroid 5-alpha reductase family enzyme